MKRFLMTLGALALLGAGCTGGTPLGQQPDPWFLTFENGDTWYTYQEYWRPGVDFLSATPSTARGENAVWIQNVPQPIHPELIQSYKDSYDYYEGDDWKIVNVTAYPKPGAKIPPRGVEESRYGNQTFWHRVTGGRNVYYWESESRVYEMFVMTAQGNDVGADELLSTIAEVEGVVDVSQQ